MKCSVRASGNWLLQNTPGVLLLAVCLAAALAAGNEMAPGHPGRGAIYLVGALLAMAAGLAASLARGDAASRQLLTLSRLQKISGCRGGLSHAVARAAEVLREHQPEALCSLLVYQTARGERIAYEARAGILATPLQPGAVFDLLVQAIRRRGEVQRMLELRLGHILGTKALVLLPLCCEDEGVGVLALCLKRRPSQAAIRTLVELLGDAARVLKCMESAECGAREAERRERERLSNDLHDGTIQPYLGLKLGLEALRRKLPPSSLGYADVKELVAMTEQGIIELRSYACRLRAARRAGAPESLVEVVRREAEAFAKATGIEVRVEAGAGSGVASHLSSEVGFMVREGLSNIRRHSFARQALVGLRRKADAISIEFVNESERHGSGVANFTPRSLSERARDLGGRVSVHGAGCRTAVTVELPL